MKNLSVKKDNLVDTNLLIRFLTADDPQKALRVKQLLSSHNKFFIPDLVFAEIVWVLQTFYGVARSEIHSKLKSLLNFDAIICNKKLLLAALENYQAYSFLSFVDAYLISLAQLRKSHIIYSYDQSFDKVKRIKRIEP